MAQRPIKTPCVGLCTLDIGSGQCIGCRRSKAEIKAWMGMSDEQREIIMEKLPERGAKNAKTEEKQ